MSKTTMRINRGRDYRGKEDRDRMDNKDGFRSTIPRPDHSALKRQIAQHEKEIANYNEELSDIKSKQDKIRGERNKGRHEFESAKADMSKLIDVKKALQTEKKSIEISRDTSHKKIISGQENEKAAKSAIKFSSVEAIDKQIKELERRQARTSMSLTEEKNLMKEIKSLNLNKKNFASLEGLRAETDKERVIKSGLDKKYAEKNGELREIYKKIDTQKAVLDGLNKASSETNKQWPEYKKRQEELRSLIESENSNIKALRIQIKEKEDEHAAAVAEEKKQYKEALAEQRKKEEEEELSRHPYEEEMYICDFLITYLSTKCVVDSKVSSITQEISSSTADFSSFGGMKSLKKNDDEMFMGGVTKKKGKKKGGQNNKTGITHTHESLEYFSSIGVTPPTKQSLVHETLKELNEKKEYFNGLERGAVPSLKTLRAKEKNAKAPEKSDKKTNDKSIFNMDSQSEYPDL